jgi:cell division protease FtsH
MVVLLGGRVTEHIIFGTITTGASDDLRKVHELSRSMITQYGMGTELKSKQLPSDDYSMSDHTRRQVDEEMQYLTDLAHRRAMQIVSEHRPLLDALAHTLLENEVLERDDIERLVTDHRGDGGSNGSTPSPIVPLGPGAAQVAAAERLDQPGGSSPSQ